jgi:putative ABC transport system substrate-binding protein
MRRREFISVIAAAATWPLKARAQQAVPVIGYLTEDREVQPLTAAFHRGLAGAGYVQGKNVAIEYRFMNSNPELLHGAAVDLVRLNVNVIAATTPASVAAARNATTTIPIVAIDLESDPVAIGYTKGLARPSENITGMFLDLPELSAKHLGLLKEIIPRLARIAIFGVPILNAAQFAATETAARMAAIEAEALEVRVADDFEPVLATAQTRHAEAGILLSSPLVFYCSEQIGRLALAKRLPLISLFDVFPKSGGLISYGPDIGEIFRKSGDYVAKILHGAKPKELPIQRPERFALVINLKTAIALGLDVPMQLQQLADEIIE